jgi:hypothetical protein
MASAKHLAVGPPVPWLLLLAIAKRLQASLSCDREL